MTLILYKDGDLCVRNAAIFGGDVCVVTFDSYTDARNLNRRGFGEQFFLDQGINAIHVVPRDNCWYQYPQLANLAKVIASITGRFRRVFAYGSSMGAYAAIRFGRLVGASEAIALSPQYSIDPAEVPFEKRWPHEAALLDFRCEKIAPAPFTAKSWVFYDPRNLDRHHAEMFAGQTDLIHVKIANSGHPCTGYLAEVGILKEAVTSILAGRFNPQNFEEYAFSRRRASPQYYFSLAQKTNRPPWKIALAARAALLSPKNAGYLSFYAYTLADGGFLDRALSEIGAAIELEPANRVVLYRASEVYEICGDPASALRMVDEILSLEPHALAAARRKEHLMQKSAGGHAPQPKISRPSVRNQVTAL